MINETKYPNSFFVEKALRDLELAIAMPGNIEYLRDLPADTDGALSFAKSVCSYLNAIERAAS